MGQLHQVQGVLIALFALLDHMQVAPEIRSVNCVLQAITLQQRDKVAA